MFDEREKTAESAAAEEIINGRKKQVPEIWKELPDEYRPKIRYWLPAAAVKEADLKEELEELQKRGFGGVEIVSLDRLNSIVSLSEDGWGKEKWNRIMKFIARETKRLGMSLDIANGPGWPISSPAVSSAEDPAAAYELTFGIAEASAQSRFCKPLPLPRTKRKEGTPKLVQAMAYWEIQPGVLLADTFLDLTGQSDVLLPPAPAQEGRWLIFAFYGQPTAQKINAGQSYVIDHLSREGAEACRRYWSGFFGEYLEQGGKMEDFASMESIFCDSLEYQAALDWTPEFPEEFYRRRGYSILSYLPFIGLPNLFPQGDIPGFRTPDRRLSDQVNHDYLEVLTQCYCENHLAELEKMAEAYGKTIRYQVAYNKPFEVERSALFVSVPENEALGRPSIDFQKTMAAAAHFGRKKRYSFECAAEFGNSYGQDYEDLFWWVKRSLMAGMNAQVLHGASYSGGYEGAVSEDGFIPNTCWPGYEGFDMIVSNYWNRTLSTRDSRECMDTITRMNRIFRLHALVDCAVLRTSYSNDGLGSEFCLYQDQGCLSNAGYSYEFVSEYLLNLLKERIFVEKGRVLMDAQGASYKCLIVPSAEAMSLGLLKILQQLCKNGFPVVWLGNAPQKPYFYGECSDDTKRREWEKTRDETWGMRGVLHEKDAGRVPSLLEENGIWPDILTDGQMDLMTAARTPQKEGREGSRYYAVYTYNRVEYAPESPNPEETSCSAVFRHGTTRGSYRRPGLSGRRFLPIGLKGKGVVFSCNPFDGYEREECFEYDPKTGYMRGTVAMEEDELKIFRLDEGRTPGMKNAREETKILPVKFESLELEAFEPGREGERSFLRSGYFGNIIRKNLCGEENLKPWRKIDPALEHFAGKGVYRGSIFLAEKEESAEYILHLGNVSDTFRVWVNGRESGFPDQVRKCVEISQLLREGSNDLVVRVVSNLYNRLYFERSCAQKGGAPYVPRDYGIWPTKDKPICLIRKRFKKK